MPITRNIDVTDNLIVNFCNRSKKKTFTVTIVNTGKRSVRIKRIHSSLDFVSALNFNELNSVIKAGNQERYLFEAAYEQQGSSDLNEGKIRFTFKDHTHVTRAIKIVDETHENENKARKNAAKNTQNPTKAPLTPGIINLRGIIKADYDNSFKEQINRLIDVTDALHIKFDHLRSSQPCTIFFRNNSWKTICLQSIEMDKTKIALCHGFNDQPMTIGPRDHLKLDFQAHFVFNKLCEHTQIDFHFEKFQVRRTIQIQYQMRGSAIPKTEYDIPIELNELFETQYRISRSEYLDALDKWVPSPNVNYKKVIFFIPCIAYTQF